MGGYSIYLISPKGYEDKSSIVVAENPQSAKDKACTHPKILELISMGAEVDIIDISHQVNKLGFHVDVSRIGLYH